MSIRVRKLDNDPELVREYTMSPSEFFAYAAEGILDYLEENMGDYDEDRLFDLIELLDVLKTEDYNQFLDAVNDFLYECCNGEGYEVHKIDNNLCPESITENEIEDIRRRLKNIDPKKLIYREDDEQD